MSMDFYSPEPVEPQKLTSVMGVITGQPVSVFFADEELLSVRLR